MLTKGFVSPAVWWTALVHCRRDCGT